MSGLFWLLLNGFVKINIDFVSCVACVFSELKLSTSFVQVVV
jgi:hypothetical protein